MLTICKQLDKLLWQDVPQEACRLAKAAAGPYQVIQDLLPSFSDSRFTVWYNPDRETAYFNYPFDTDTDKVASCYVQLKEVPGVELVKHGYLSTPSVSEKYILIKAALDNKSVFGPVASSMQLKPNSLNALWGGPNPLASTLAGGLLGAGAGYLGGYLGEQILPEKHFEKGKLRRTLALLGGGIGATPGLYWGINNMREGKGLLSGWIDKHPYPDAKHPYPDKSKEVTANDNRYSIIKEALESVLKPEIKELNERFVKYADEAGAEFNMQIPVDQFGRTIWNDLRSAGGYTSAPLAAATTGILQAASTANGGANLISPFDIARIGVGMGSGYLSGMLVGKTLGALAGLRPETQQTLQDTGVWAGVLSNIVPLAFRGY